VLRSPVTPVTTDSQFEMDSFTEVFQDKILSDPLKRSALQAFVFYHGCYWVCRGLYPLISSTYAKLERDKKGYWCSSTISTLHSVVLVILAVLAVREDPQILNSENVFYKSEQARKVESHFVGYLCSDLLLTIYYRVRWNGWVENLVHHLTVLTVWGQFFHYDYGHFFGGMAHFCEITTPFVNQRWFMYESGMSDTRIYFYNGLAMTFLWFVSRIVMYTYLGVVMIQTKDQWFTLQPWQYLSIYFSYTTGFFLQYFWFYKILRGAIKSIRKAGLNKKKKEM